MTESPYRILGALGSPYSVKMRAVLRYRRLPHIWVNLDQTNRAEFANVKPAVIPIIQYPDGSYHNDSTPMIYDLEQRHKARSIVPDDEAMGFIAYLIEDMADEWGTKIMFHYRWHGERDQREVSRWLAFGQLANVGADAIDEMARKFAERQIARMPLVGCTEDNRPLIEETALRVMKLLDRHVPNERFLFGSRPSLADFGWYGQLYQLSIDPTPSDLMRAEAPFTYRWISEIDDASGVDGDWRDAHDPVSDAVIGLLKLAGEVYLPFLIANATAFDQGDEQFSLTLAGHSYGQAPFKYQVKCLVWLRERFAALSPEARDLLEPILKETDCLHRLTLS